MVKIQIIQSDEEKHTLSQDMGRLMLKRTKEFCDSVVKCFQDTHEEEDTPIYFHSLILKTRSPILGLKLQEYKDPEHSVRELPGMN